MSTVPQLRASRAERWVPCPESAWLEPQYPKPDSEESREGTAAHEMAEAVLTGVVSTPEELLDRQASNGVVWVKEMIDPVMMYVDHVKSHDVAYWVEETVSVEVSETLIIPGHCDGASFGFGEGSVLYIDDFKYGFSPVDVVRNYQLLIYMIGIIDKYNLPVGTSAVLSIVQPRGWHPDGPIRSWRVSADSLTYYREVIKNAAIRASENHRQATTGNHCNYCSALAFCSAGKTAAMNAVDLTYQAIPDTDTPEQVAGLIDALNRAHKAIKHTLSAVESRAEAMILNGKPVPGYSIQPGNGKRIWIDEQATLALASAMGVDLTEKKTVTPAEAERRGLSKELVKSLARTPSTAPRLVKCDMASKADEVFK